ncbi:MAG: hypothetical protein RL141_22 [Candidatus Parcubacteria bacterium]|jgi:GT2 family glycosyltransferase
MLDLRVVVVSWNVEGLLRRCLASLPEACAGLVWDVVVVDNASADGSVNVATAAGAMVIANGDNRGFAKACNQGMAGSDARYILLLNPDTECPAGSLTALVREADARPDAGIVGPKLLNTDGSVQTSIRRFPTFWSQVGVMLKLHNFFPRLFGHYFAEDVSLEKEQDVDQVMGSCFLIRRALMEQIGGLDERYFIWFEEVDYCRQAVQRGWTVRYLPSVSVTHHGGQSFDQVFSLRKQRYLNASVVAYFKKWHGEGLARALRMLAPVSLALAWMVGRIGLSGWGSKKVLGGNRLTGNAIGGVAFFRISASAFDRKKVPPQRSLWMWASVIVGVEVLSRATMFYDGANGIATLIVGMLVAIVAWNRPTMALGLIALELLIGSHGRLLQLWGWPGVVSLRMMMFAAFFAGWGARAFWKVGVMRILKERWEWVLVAVAILYGAIFGILQNPMVVADANSWLYGLLLIPVIHLAQTQKERLMRDVLPVLILGPIWLAAKAVGIEYLFAHGLAVVDPPTDFYLWIRRTGVGEVTPLTPVIHRVFMQSQVFALPALLLCTSYHFATHEKGVWNKYRHVIAWSLLAAVIALIIGYSRSLWIGAAAGLVALIVLHLRNIKSAIRVSCTAIRGAVYVLLAAAILTIAIVIPIPSAPDIADANVVTNRISTTDAASASRWDLLSAMKSAIRERPIFGYGLGATITYRSSDPRVLAANPTGAYTTSAFEWGWLDHWFKLGIFGLLAIVVLVARLGIRILRTNAEQWVKYGAFASLVALAATHFFTPYLNHPLGLGYLVMLEGWCVLNKGTKTAETV